MSDASVVSWVQAGGVLAFAAMVMWRLEKYLGGLEPTIKAFDKTMDEVKTVLAQLLERERFRDERRAAVETAHNRFRLYSDAPESPEPREWEETPPLGTIGPRTQRARTNPGGRSPSEYGPGKPPKDR